MTAHRHSAAIVAAARACVGTRFRAQGRVTGIGLDCVGVALIAAAAAGVALVPPAYALGGDHEAALDGLIAAAGCRRVVVAAPGDLLAVAPSPGRRHLAVVTGGGIVHAHAGLGRVVEGPLDPGWTIVAAWRLPEQE
ncbi:peptidoglycan endopeptidase [Polymorphobacter sp. PAMC 29334]|uniref:peptidoglycan endopeptidase n=1 Tax=Polymorphobacter sp. PAMC 29334 TaxID=2862331 RepID=UPI001C772B19|nr:peptidoglycan endopeptidase [Polymorphobacter sp. PAMC 29334]QYE33702.1 peptidoglycan endopeptidase [Polymorphobacter sp. PAMC 29334]